MISDSRLHAMAGDLADVDGVVAVALGGSRARGTHRPDSDVDLGVYYDREKLDVAALHDRAHRWNGEPVAVPAPGGWGPWVDGGAWLTVDDTPVDWILRDVDRVRKQCHRARRGEFAFFAQPGHPLGFLDVAYAGEVATAAPLADPSGALTELRALVTPYPEALRSAMLDNLWQVDFLLDGAMKGAKRGDAVYVALCASHAALIAAHGWHAAARQWATNEKGLVTNVARLDLDTHGFTGFVTAALADLGEEPKDLASALTRLKRMPRPATTA